MQCIVLVIKNYICVGFYSSMPVLALPENCEAVSVNLVPEFSQTCIDILFLVSIKDLYANFHSNSFVFHRNFLVLCLGNVLFFC